jgi:hypothetical protein
MFNIDITQSLFSLARPAGPNFPITTYETFIAGLARFDRNSMIRRITFVSWAAWEQRLPSKELNDLARSLGSRLAAITAACCVGTEVVADDAQVIDQIWRFLAVEELASLDEELEQAADTLLREASKHEELVKLIADTDQARTIMAQLTAGRIFRAQWHPHMHQLDKIFRFWLVIKRIDQTGELFVTLRKMLNMEPDRFIRAALVIMSLAYQGIGHIELTTATSDRLTPNLDVTLDDLMLAASRLSRSPEEFVEWHRRDVLERAQRGFYQYTPNPLAITPLIALSDGFYCPSIDMYLAAIENVFRGMISSLDPISRERRADEYGAMLEEYVTEFAQEIGGKSRVHRIERFESAGSKKADLLLVDNDVALVVEIKRTIGTTLEKDILDAESAVAIFAKLTGALMQCKTSIRRMPWRRAQVGTKIKITKAVILADDLMITEGNILAAILYNRGAIDPHFEVLGMTDFEDALAIDGIRSLALTIQRKWLTGHCGMPLRQYVRTVQGKPRASAANGRQLLDREAASILGALKFPSLGAQWP